MKKQTRPHNLTAPLSEKVCRGFIPASVRADDSVKDIVSLYGVSVNTAYIWKRILAGPKIN